MNCRAREFLLSFVLGRRFMYDNVLSGINNFLILLYITTLDLGELIISYF